MMKLILLGISSCLAFTAFGQTPPPNDAFTNRLGLTGLHASAQATNTFATKEAGEPNHAGQSPRRSLWWSWQAPFDGVAQLSVTNAGYLRTRPAVYAGNNLANLAVVATPSSSYVSGDTRESALNDGSNPRSLSRTGYDDWDPVWIKYTDPAPASR